MKKFDNDTASALASNRAPDGSLKLVILAGSGVSLNEPSRLPLGYELTHYYLSSCVGERVAHAMEGRWKRIAAEANRAVGAPCSSMRLESIIEKIDDVDREFGYTPIMEGFREFSDIAPNSLHRHIASLARIGAKIVTPNFDCGIERALGCRSGERGGDAGAAVYDESLGVYVGTVGDAAVYHYHGVGTDPDGLGATVKRMLRGFKPAFADLLCSWFEDGYSLLCVGFACVDYFDATKFFESMQDGGFPGMAVFCNHTDEETCDISVDQQQSRTCFIRGFRDRLMTFGVSKDVLYEIVTEACGVREAVDNSRDGDSRGERGIRDWKRGFERIRASGEHDSRLYLIRVMNQFGFYLSGDDVAGILGEEGLDVDPRDLGPFADSSSCRDIVRNVSTEYLERIKEMGGERYFLDDSRFLTQSRSIGFDFKMISRDMELRDRSSSEIAELYDRAFSKRTEHDSHIDSRGSI